MDFSIKTYQSLLKALIKQDYSFQSFQEFLKKPASKSIILRHDVDKLPENSLRFAQIQHALGIKGTYYFRIVPENMPDGSQGFNHEIIGKIAELGHEIGYHYEDVDIASQNHKIKDKSKKTKIDFEKKLANKAIELFEKNLNELRAYYPIKTICMHGSPLSKYDNKLLWKYYNYRDYGIIGEPYFDIDFSKVLYLTDTGRKWNGDKVSIRDKVSNHKSQITNYNKLTQHFHSTSDIIYAANNQLLPNQIMFTFHPQRWTDQPILWAKEFAFQNVKNIAKYFLNKART